MFQPVLSRKQLDKELSKLKKLKYNQFRWWRMYDAPNKPLDTRKLLRDRILNGDFDYSHYKYQVMYCEYMLNDLEEKYFHDTVQLADKASIWRTRRKRLQEDAEKDEADKLSSLITEFTKYYRLNKQQVEEEMLKYSGSLIDFYYHIDDKYKITFKLMPKRRGRPRKNG